MVLAAVREMTADGEIFMEIDRDNVLVKSKSESGVWHSIQLWNGRPCSCTCRGYEFRGDCRHVRALDAAQRAA